MQKQGKKKKTTDQRISNTYTLITGASSGIGEATAYKLASQGEALILLARRKQKLQLVKKQCEQLGSPKVITLDFDLRKISFTKERKKFTDDIKEKNLFVKNLINSAGLAKGTELLQNSNPADWDQMLETNVSALLKITHLLLPHIIENRGSIVNLGSVAGRLVYEGGAVYCATKFAVRALSEGLRMDLKGTGVRVINIEPGMVNTEFSKVRLGDEKKAAAVYADMMPLTAQDVAESIFFCLNQPAHVNVQELLIYPTDQASVGQVIRGEKSMKNLI